MPKLTRRDLIKTVAVTGVTTGLSGAAKALTVPKEKTPIGRAQARSITPTGNVYLDRVRQSVSDVEAQTPAAPTPITNPITQSGQAPLPANLDEQQWHTIGEALRSVSGFTEGSASAAPSLLRLDRGLGGRVSLDSKVLKESFRPWHVENLLDQSADLLDRAVRAKSDGSRSGT